VILPMPGAKYNSQGRERIDITERNGSELG
jgi:hypothetical protein